MFAAPMASNDGPRNQLKLKTGRGEVQKPIQIDGMGPFPFQ